MAKFNFENAEEKSALRERAMISKPRVHNVVATELGWCIPRPNGTLEVLVRFHGLDDILGDLSLDINPVIEAAPVVEVIVETPAAVEVIEAAPVVEVIEAVVEEVVIPVAPKKPGPKPKVVLEV